MLQSLKKTKILERLRKKKVGQNTSLFSELDAKVAYAKMSGSTVCVSI